MKRFKVFLVEHLKPVDLKTITKVLVSNGIPSDKISRLTRSFFDAECLSINCNDVLKDVFFSENEAENKKNIEKLNNSLLKYKWSVNYVNQEGNEIWIRQQNIHDISSTTTADPGDWATATEDDTDLKQTTYDIRKYGFLHVTDIPPNQITRTGLRAKESKTFDKHDEKRIYLFSLAPGFINRRPNITNNITPETIASIQCDTSYPLAHYIVNFAADRVTSETEDPNAYKYLYFIKRLPKPAKIYKDDMFHRNSNLRNAVFIKDYNIPPSDIQFVCTIDELKDALIKTYGKVDGYGFPTTSIIDTLADNSKSKRMIDSKLYDKLAETYRTNTMFKRIVHLARHILLSSYEYNLSVDEILKLFSTDQTVVRNLYYELFEDEDEIAMEYLHGATKQDKEVVYRTFYSRYADMIVAVALNAMNHKDIQGSEQFYADSFI